MQHPRASLQLSHTYKPQSGLWFILFGLLWLGLFYLPPFTWLWQWLDAAFINFAFHYLTFPPHEAYFSFLALTNWRVFDVVTGLILNAIIWGWIFCAPTGHLRWRRIWRLSCIAILVILTKVGLDQILKYGGWQRLSPTETIAQAPRLSELSPIPTKDRTSSALPSDHAVVIFTIIAAFWRVHWRSIAIGISVLFTPLIFPRMLVGAHWLSDAAVGSIAVVAVGLGLDHLLISSWAGTEVDNAKTPNYQE